LTDHTDKGHGFRRAFFVSREQVQNIVAWLREKDSSVLIRVIRGFEFPAAFSFSFHKEVLSSTVSAQHNVNFPLHTNSDSRRVLTVQREMH
jgi:hypothetical protein